MIGPTAQTLAALVCAYAIYEFFVSRIAFGTVRKEAPTTATAWKLALLHLLTMSICTAGILTLSLVAGYTVLAALTFVYERVGARPSLSESHRRLEWFIGKQTVAGILLFAIWRTATPNTAHAWYNELEHSFLLALGASVDDFHRQQALILAVVAAYMFMIDGGTRIVRGVFDKFPQLYENVVRRLNRSDRGVREENVGEWIGVLERLITLTFVLTGNLTAMAFALTAKSIVRFKELEDKEFSEYYLLGTSASLIVALFAGMAIKVLFNI